MGANDRQPGGGHYKDKAQGGWQHWDYCARNRINYLESAASKYVSRWRTKGSPVLDLEKAVHYTDKAIELIDQIGYAPGGHVPQDQFETFAKAYGLGKNEYRACQLLMQWACKADLEEARDLIHDHILPTARAV